MQRVALIPAISRVQNTQTGCHICLNNQFANTIRLALNVILAINLSINTFVPHLFSHSNKVGNVCFFQYASSNILATINKKLIEHYILDLAFRKIFNKNAWGSDFKL